MGSRFFSALCLSSLLFSSQLFAAGDFSPGDYKKALWMTTRFYGAQRSGIGPNWLIMEHQNPEYRTSFTKDADGSYNLEGGWFDCGDHVLFGQTFFYSAYVLAKAYESFPTGFHDLYNGRDYSDYMESGNWDISGGTPNGIPDLLEELKYATDWIIKATPNSSTFYSQKGNGDFDHKQWVTAGKMSTLPVEEGGEPRPVTKNPNDGAMPALASATLSVMSRIYRKYDSEYADLCLQHARYAFSYAESHKGQSTGSGGYYGSKPNPTADFVTAAAELYASTGEQQYRAAAENNKSSAGNHYYTFCYNNCDDVALYCLGTTLRDEEAMTNLKSWYVDKYKDAGTGEAGLSTLGDGWGFLRYPANQAFIAALYSKAKNTTDYDQFIFNQVDYIMGSNDAKNSFIVGFCSGCTKSPQWPHHRNVYLNDNNDMETLTGIPERNRQFGYLVGFTRENSRNFQEAVDKYTQTEGGIDYNAGLVGALGYIVSKVDPADTSKMGTSAISGKKKSEGRRNFKIRVVENVVTIDLKDVFEISDVAIYDFSGRMVHLKTNPGSSFTLNTSRMTPGMYFLRCKSGKNAYTAQFLVN